MRDPNTQKERKRIIKDIINHKVEEVTVGEGDDIESDELDEYESRLEEMTDSELARAWNGVGDWVASRGFDPETQYEKLLEDGKTDYGYVGYRYDQPY